MKLKILFLFAFLVCTTNFIYSQNDTISPKVVYKDYSSIVIYEIAPMIIGGIDSLNMKIVYPEAAILNKIEGKVFVQVKIDTLGTPSKPVILKGIGFGCNEEAIRLVMNSIFDPAIQSSKKVKSVIVIPVIFKLPKG